MKPQCCVAVAVTALLAATAATAQTRRFTLDTPASLAGAAAVGVALHPDGSLQAIPALKTVAEFQEPLGLALAADGEQAAWVGTGHPARLWHVTGEKKTLRGELDADQITALLALPDGDLYIATAVPAGLWRLTRRGNAPELVSRLPEGNIWDLAWFRGELIAAAGNPGRLLRLQRDGLVLAADIPDSHARCLAVQGDTLLVGTSGRGLVLRWDGRTPVGVLLESAFTEIASLVSGPDGVVWAAAVTGDPTLGRPPARAEGEPAVTVTVGEAAAASAGPSRGQSTSEILRILPAGAGASAHRFTKELAGTVAWGLGGLLIGTGLEGQLWQLVGGAAVRLDTVDAVQVVRIAGGGHWVLTQGPVQLLRRTGLPGGTLTSPAMDAGQPSRWGRFSVRFGTPVPGSCTLRFRSGAVATPDETWSAWSPAARCEEGLVSAPPARYLQWQVSISGPAGSRIHQVEMAYRQVNQPPEIREFRVHEPAEIFLRTPPPADRVIELTHPDLSGIFTTLSEEPRESPDRLGKRYFRVGFRTLSWRAEDPNGDPLLFTVEVQRENSQEWWPVRSGLDAVSLSLDTQALADGLYRFRLRASDAPANPAEPSEVTSLSSWVVVDNTAPRILMERQGGDWLVTVEDDASPLIRVEWNRNADRWQALHPEDGLLDSRREIFRIPIQRGSHVLAVRAVDAHYNRTTIAVEESP